MNSDQMTFGHLGPLAKGATIGSFTFKLTKISDQKAFGDGTLQLCDGQDLAGNTGTVAFYDRDPLDKNQWLNVWVEARSEPGHGNMANKLFGVVVGEYKDKKRIEIKKTAGIYDAQVDAAPPAQRQQAPAQRQQSPTQQAPAPQQQRQAAPSQAPAAQQQPRQATQAAKPPGLRQWAAKLAFVYQAAHDAAVHIAAAEKVRHGVCRPQEAIGALSSSIYIELVRRVDWADVPVADLTKTQPPRLPLINLINGTEAPVEQQQEPAKPAAQTQQPRQAPRQQRQPEPVTSDQYEPGDGTEDLDAMDDIPF